jgi:hypothetical protein
MLLDESAPTTIIKDAVHSQYSWRSNSQERMKRPMQPNAVAHDLREGMTDFSAASRITRSLTAMD